MAVKTKIGSDWITIVDTGAEKVYEIVCFDDDTGDEHRILLDDHQLDHIRNRAEDLLADDDEDEKS